MYKHPLLSQFAIACLLPFGAGSALASADMSRLTYDVFLDDKEIGQHVFEFQREGEELVVESVVDMSVKLLFVEVFSYEHSASERWRDGCLTQLTSQTLQNGERFDVLAEVKSQQLFVQRRTGELSVNAGGDTSDVRQLDLEDGSSCVVGYAYWDKALLDQSQLLNAQLGELDEVRFEADGGTSLDWLEPAGGVEIARYELTSNGAKIELWYDDSGQWLGLRTKRGKRWLEYRLDLAEMHTTPGQSDQIGAVFPHADLIGSTR